MERINWKSEYETLEKVAFSLEMECRKESLRKIINELASEINLETKLFIEKFVFEGGKVHEK